jgi:HEAT repeat protein
MAWLLPPLPPNFEAALRDVHGKRVESRLAAAERLGRAEDGERTRALEGLLTLLDDAQPSVRATALAALGMLAASEALPRVLKALREELPAVRELAALAAAQIGGDEAVAALREALQSDAPEVRFQAVAALAELTPDGVLHDILPLLNDPDAEVRAQVIAALASLRAAHLAGHFAGALEDDSPLVRIEAGLALAALSDKRGEAELLRALHARERPLEVPDALARLASEHAREPLARQARSLFSPPHLRAAAGAALVRLGDARGAAALRRVVTGFRPDARSYAVELVGEVQAEELVPELVRLVERPRGVDLGTLVDALARFPQNTGARTALELMARGSGEIAARARSAVGPPPGKG